MWRQPAGKGSAPERAVRTRCVSAVPGRKFTPPKNRATATDGRAAVESPTGSPPAPAAHPAAARRGRPAPPPRPGHGSRQASWSWSLAAGCGSAPASRPARLASRFDSGSSRRRRSGDRIKARARAPRCACPPESSDGRRWPRPESCTRSSIAATRVRCRAAGIAAHPQAEADIARPVSCAETGARSGTPSPPRAGLADGQGSTGRPGECRRRQAPISPAISFSRVDLPEPEGPRSAVSPPQGPSATGRRSPA